MDSKHELLKKLKMLAEQGVGGEKINAQRLLASYMKKHGITEEELNEERTLPCEFKSKTDIEETLLYQVIYKVTNDKKIYGFTRRNRRIKHLVGCECTQAQRIEIEFLFDFYKRLYKKDAALFLSAFIQKHELFGKLKDGESPAQIDKEELLKMSILQGGMSDEKPLKQITGGGGNVK